MSKYAVKNTPFLTIAVLDMLDAAGYDGLDYIDGEEGGFILVNTDKQTYKHRDTTTRDVIDPATNWAAVATLVAPVATPAAATPTFAVGDQVQAVNLDGTKPKFRLQEGHVYTVDRITAKGNLGLAGLPNDEYLQKRFTKVTADRYVDAVATAAAARTATDEAGNTVAVGDTVLVKQPTGKKHLFNLRPNGVATITRITAKGALGFAFDGDNEFLAKRFQKVTLSSAAGNVQSGDLVVASARRDGQFVLPQDTALTFRGVTVTKGNFILDGYAADQYSPSRFQKVTLVG